MKKLLWRWKGIEAVSPFFVRGRRDSRRLRKFYGKRMCRGHKSRVFDRPASLQKIQPSRWRCDNAHLPGRPRYIMTGQGNDPVPDWKALAKVGTRSDSDLLFRPGIRWTSARDSSPTDTIGADGERPTGDARSVRTQETGGASKAGHSSQLQYQGPYPIHL